MTMLRLWEKTRSSSLLPLVIAAAMILALSTSSASAATRTYTLDADFDEGILFNLNHDAPNNDQLQLNTTTTPFPFIWIACSARGTVVRIDVNTGQVLGEYRTAPVGRGLNPSRTTVDLFGNVWTGNRNEATGGQGSAVKIGLVIGGTRGDKNPDGTFTPNPAGQYVAPPFQYNTCVDRDSDGYIKTSLGLGNILNWIDVTDGAGGPNGIVQDAEDEAILLYQRTTGPNTRHVSIDANNDVWVAGYPFAITSFDKLDGNTGAILTSYGPQCGGYGGLIDGNGVMWSSSFSQGLLYRYDHNTSASMCIPIASPYGLGIDTNGYIWNSMWTQNRISKFSPAGVLEPGFPKLVGGSACRGVAITPVDNHVWVANSNSNTVSRLDNNGNNLANIPVGSLPTGVAVDANGKVWVACLSSDNAMRIDPNIGLGVVDLTVNLGPGAGPYNYSDMTGTVAIGSTAPQGSWNVVYDGGEPGAEWGRVSWNSTEPAGTNVVVKIRTADSIPALAVNPFTTVGNGVDFTGHFGQFIEIQTVLSKPVGGTMSPVLFDLTVTNCTTFDVVFGTSWDGVSLQEVLDAEYGVGAINAATDYEGYRCGDADPPYWEDEELDGLLVREVAGFSVHNIFGWYEETFSMPTIDGVNDAVIFDGFSEPPASVVVTFPAGLTTFGFYLNPNGTSDSHNAPEPEMFFTNRGFNDIGPDGSGAIHEPTDGDVQCLVYNITHLRNDVPTFVLAWEDLDYGSELWPTYLYPYTDNDFQDMVIEISALTPVPAAVAGLRAENAEVGIRLSWDVAGIDQPTAVHILRGSGGDMGRYVSTWRGSDARAQGSWVDMEAMVGVSYAYQLIVEIEGTAISSERVEIQRTSSVKLGNHLVANRPNPFNPKTTIFYSMARPGDAALSIYDVSGRLVRRYELGHRPAGVQSIEWNGNDARGSRVASGAYVVQLVTDHGRDQMRIALIK